MVQIRRTPKIDTRQGIVGIPTKLEMLSQTYVHVIDVQMLVKLLFDEARVDVINHDWTKVQFIDDFRDNFVYKANGNSFKDHHWWKAHVSSEKHHCLDFPFPDELLLTDFIHMAADWVAAGKARGTWTKEQSIPKKFHFDDSIALKNKLYTAYYNTLKYFDKHSKVVQGPV